jgi:hypothetical protein
MNLSKILAAALCVASASLAGAAPVAVTELSPGAKVSEMKAGAHRTADKYVMSVVPEELVGAVCVSTLRGATNKPGSGFSFAVDKPCTAYLLYMQRGNIKTPEGWEKTSLSAQWKVGSGTYKDTVFKKTFPAGTIEIPVNNSAAGSYGIPHMVVLTASE